MGPNLCEQFNHRMSVCSCEGANNVLETQMLQTETGDFKHHGHGLKGKTRSSQADWGFSRKCDESSLAFHAPADSVHRSMFSREADEEAHSLAFTFLVRFSAEILYLNC